MAGIFVYSEDVALAKELVGFARAAGKAASILTFDEAAAAPLAQLGAETVYVLRGGEQIVENNAKAVAAFFESKGGELLVIGASPRGRDLAARAAGYLDAALICDASSVVCAAGTVRTERIVFGGAVILPEEVQGVCVLTLSAGKFEAATGATSEIVAVDIKKDDRVRLISTEVKPSKGVDLTAADTVIGVGLGLEQQADLKLVQELAETIGEAGISGTRALCEIKHWLPNYIGISGLVVKPSLYVAVGISGQIQHIVGVRDAKIITAIDLNEKAPIFAAADYGIVGDLYEILPLLIEALKNNT